MERKCNTGCQTLQEEGVRVAGSRTDWRAIPQVVVSRSPALGATRKQERKSHFKGCRVGRDFRFRKAFPRNAAKLKVTLQDHTVNAASVVVEQSQRLEFCFYCFVPHISFQMRAGLAPNASLSKNRGKVWLLKERMAGWGTSVVGFIHNSTFECP